MIIIAADADMLNAITIQVLNCGLKFNFTPIVVRPVITASELNIHPNMVIATENSMIHARCIGSGEAGEEPKFLFLSLVLLVFVTLFFDGILALFLYKIICFL